MSQKTHPVSDVTTTDWSKTPSGAASFAATLGEIPEPDDANYVASPNDPVAKPIEVKLWAPGWPKKEGDHVLRVRLRKTDSGSLPATVLLLQGSKVIAVRRPTLTTSFATYSDALMAAEVAQITDYTDLRVRVLAGDVVVDCCEEPIPSVLYVTMHDQTSNCPAMEGLHFMLMWNGTVWTRPQSGYGYENAAITLVCDPVDESTPRWIFNITGQCAPGVNFDATQSFLPVVDCSPFYAETGGMAFASGSPCCESGAIAAVISSTPP